MVGTWLGEIRSCSCLAVLPDSAWVLLNKIYQPFSLLCISSSFQIFCFLTQSIPFVVVVVVLIALVIQRGVVLRRMTVLVRDPQAVRQVVHHVLEHPLLELVGGYRRPANGDAPGPLVKLLLLFHLEPLLKKIG